YYNVNFIIDGNSVYPDGYTGNEPEVKFDELVIFPNPANETINIITPYNEFEVEIVNVLGQVVIKESNCRTIDVSGLAAGSYVVRFYSDKGASVKRLIAN
ncbi:MAG: T9SS type A sorting domain-containing protein, partial [Clostridia bacterium]|nr:T9SS type A sorting domain-containing protein [Clostridia bacterium]